MIKHKEIILIRVFGSNLETIKKEVNEKLQEFSAAEKQIKIELYRNMSLPTDLSVHIDYYDTQKRKASSVIGQLLAEALKEFGLINHSVWKIESQ